MEHKIVPRMGHRVSVFRSRQTNRKKDQPKTSEVRYRTIIISSILSFNIFCLCRPKQNLTTPIWISMTKKDSISFHFDFF